MSKFFKFEDEKNDFPFYNGKPSLSKMDWLILLAGLLIFIGILLIPLKLDSNLVGLILCLSVLLPTLYVLKGNYGLIFRKPQTKDIKLIFLCLLGYYVYTLSVVSILSALSMPTAGNAIFGVNMDLAFWINVILQLMGEELYKLLVFLIVMALVYRFTNRRKIAMICGIIVAIFSFGLLHYSAYAGNLAQIIFVIGLGSLIYLYAYLKTKNIVVSYMVHLLIDGLPFLIAIINGL